jgi:hypothetical protein
MTIMAALRRFWSLSRDRAWLTPLLLEGQHDRTPQLPSTSLSPLAGVGDSGSTTETLREKEHFSAKDAMVSLRTRNCLGSAKRHQFLGEGFLRFARFGRFATFPCPLRPLR